MGSQSDYDQGGTFRQLVRRYLGPSIGWIDSPDENVVPVSVGGTTNILNVNIDGIDVENRAKIRELLRLAAEGAG